MFIDLKGRERKRQEEERDFLFAGSLSRDCKAQADRLEASSLELCLGLPMGGSCPYIRVIICLPSEVREQGAGSEVGQPAWDGMF